MTKIIEIFKDPSGITLGYEIKDDVGEVLVCGSGYGSKNEILEYWQKVFLLLKKANQSGEFDNKDIRGT